MYDKKNFTVRDVCSFLRRTRFTLKAILSKRNFPTRSSSSRTVPRHVQLNVRVGSFSSCQQTRRARHTPNGSQITYYGNNVPYGETRYVMHGARASGNIVTKKCPRSVRKRDGKDEMEKNDRRQDFRGDLETRGRGGRGPRKR